MAVGFCLDVESALIADGGVGLFMSEVGHAELFGHSVGVVDGQVVLVGVGGDVGDALLEIVEVVLER